jgi:hypothetical protein
LDEYYYTYSNIVMPIQYGAGMKVKTAEAMMFGMTIFATNEALEGYEVDDYKGIYRCNTAMEFIMAIRKMNESFWQQNTIRECFLQQYESKVVEKKFVEVMQTWKS